MSIFTANLTIKYAKGAIWPAFIAKICYLAALDSFFLPRTALSQAIECSTSISFILSSSKEVLSISLNFSYLKCASKHPKRDFFIELYGHVRSQ